MAPKAWVVWAPVPVNSAKRAGAAKRARRRGRGLAEAECRGADESGLAAAVTVVVADSAEVQLRQAQGGVDAAPFLVADEQVAGREDGGVPAAAPGADDQARFRV